MRCEQHDAMGNRCPKDSVLIVLAVTGPDGHEVQRLWGAAACRDHTWEATAHCALRVQRARTEGDFDARVVAAVDELGYEQLRLLRAGVTVGERWPLAAPWVA